MPADGQGARGGHKSYRDAPTNDRPILAMLMLTLLGLATPVPAAEPTFLPGSRVGLVPPAGMVPSQSFQGYEDAGRQALLVITELGAGTAERVDKDFTPEAMAAGGIEV